MEAASLGHHRKHPHPAARFPFPEIITLGSRVSARHLKTDDQCLLGNSLCQTQLEFISQEADKPLRAPCLPRAGGVGPVQLAADKHRRVSLEGPCLSTRVLFFNILIVSTNPRTLGDSKFCNVPLPVCPGDVTFWKLREHKPGSRCLGWLCVVVWSLLCFVCISKACEQAFCLDKKNPGAYSHPSSTKASASFSSRGPEHSLLGA